MPYPLLMLFIGPSVLRASSGRVVTALLTASYLSGLGEAGTPITDRTALSLNSRPLVIELNSTEV